jgi:D-glycero-D-manno-heptose 1,7-bisphosphate phosphatase
MTDAVFLDRDGVINELVFLPDYGLIDSPMNPTQFKLIPGAAQAIKNFNQLGLKVIVISNQPGIAKGKMSHELFNAIRTKMRLLLGKAGAHVDAEYYCFHHPKAKLPEFKRICECRKPKPGLIQQAQTDFGLSPSQCYMIGDGLTDIKAGNAAGCKSVLIGDFKCDICRQMGVMDVKPHFIASNLIKASKLIEKESD